MKYWVVGAKWESEDMSGAFVRRGYWEMGWDDEDKPELAKRRDGIAPDDRIAMKRRDGQGANTITITNVGIVKEVFEKRVYVNWILTDINRQIPCQNFFGTIHGPFLSSEPWVKEAFCV